MGLGTETAGIPEKQNFPASSGLRHPPASSLSWRPRAHSRRFQGRLGVDLSVKWTLSWWPSFSKGRHHFQFAPSLFLSLGTRNKPRTRTHSFVSALLVPEPRYSLYLLVLVLVVMGSPRVGVSPATPRTSLILVTFAGLQRQGDLAFLFVKIPFSWRKAFFNASFKKKMSHILHKPRLNSISGWVFFMVLWEVYF